MMQNIVDFKSLGIRLASPEEIRDWSHGEVTKPETINYRTLKPEKDGLFCERIFGPTKDWECYCGKYKKIRYKGIICDKCGVEVTQSRVRRERMGHLTLATPVAHIWFFKSGLSPLSLLLDLPPRLVETVVYFGQYLVTEVNEEKRQGAEEKLGKHFQELNLRLKESYQEKIGLEQQKLDVEKEKVRQEIKNGERQAIALKEMGLRTKQKIQAIREEQIIETERQTQTQASLAERVKALRPLAVLTEEDYLRLTECRAADFFKVGMGAESLLTVISKINLAKLATELATEFRKSSGAKHLKIAKRLRLVEGMRKAKVSPSWLIIKILPVIPPDLRPMVQLTGGRFATSDLNDLYRRVINRNNRLKHLMDLGAPEIILRNEKRMLQEAVDNLIDSSRWVAGRRTKTPVLRSLSDMLRGKQGRFRQNLLGKRVDYSGRSVIVVGPELSLDQCGLPKEMALEMFKPYVLREMILRGVAPNVRSAKNILERKPAEIFDILEEITRNHPVLLNRAPTLHKLGIQAFYPVLVEGSAIRLHPCVCAGFNADFDGDQMAVHIPLSEEACQEAKNLMMARHNLLKPSDGSPISIPDAKEMAVGVYYLTSADPLLPPAETVFADKDEAILACQTGKIKLRQPIKVRLAGEILETTTGRLLFNEVLPKKLGFLNESVRRAVTKSLFARAFRACTNEEIVNLIDNVKNLGFEAGTVSGHSLSIFNCQKLPEKDKIIARAEGEVVSIEKNFNQGLITEQEKRRLTQEVWIAVTEELAEKTWASFTPENPVKMVMDAGVGRVSKDQVKQLSAMRGLGVDPLGKIVPLPVKSNFRDGLGAFEFVAGARSSRKGLTDTALKTADAGYLTRRLVDVAHGAIIREKDCQTEKGLEVSREGPRAKVFFNRLLGRLTASPVTDPKTKKVLLAKGAQITEEALGILEKAGVEKVFVRSPLTCQTRHGLCAACYGWDFANKKMVEVGTPVGVLAAQSIGEPGTQLTLRTRHVGGVVGLDVTQGLPRVEELFEVRLPKTPSPLAEVSGKVSIRQTDEGFELKIKDKAYLLPPTSNLLVEDDQKIEAGAQLASGTLDIREILRVKGLRAAQEYLLAEVQAVYESQGIPINDKHFEVIIGCMSQKVRIVEPGETEFLPGELVDKLELAKAAKGKKVVAEEIILGLTRASILTNSWLSAASFQETTNVLTEAALKSKEDPLLGLKENVIIGRLIPTSPERAKIKTGS